MRKIVGADEALAGVDDGSVVAVSGFNNALTPEYLLLKLYEMWERTGHPRKLFLESDSLPGVRGRGLDLVAGKLLERDGQDFISGVLMPFFGFAPNLMRLAMGGSIEVYSWSVGVVAYWFREIASGRPGLITKVGLRTFFDPRSEGGCANDLARERRRCRIRVIDLEGDEYLFYSAPKPNVSLIRGTTADGMGNLTMEREGMVGTVLAMAQASKAAPNPGMVVAQVEGTVPFGALHPQMIQVPGPLIDRVVVSPPEHHWQGGTIRFDPRVCGAAPFRGEEVPLKLTPEKVVARRVALELVRIAAAVRRPLLINLGVGIPAMVSSVIHEEGLGEVMIPTIESGAWGGIALSDEDFGLSMGPFAIISMPDQFSVYEGGMLDATSLGFMQVDAEGNVNPSVLPDRFTGPGGFPVIAAGSPRIYFAGAFTAGRRDIRVEDGRLVIERDGPIRKFVNHVYKVMFSGATALKNGRDVLYVTERAVLRLTNDGLTLEEYAPGVDVDREVLGAMDFRPSVSPSAVPMDPRLFRDEVMGLREDLAGSGLLD